MRRQMWAGLAGMVLAGAVLLLRWRFQGTMCVRCGVPVGPDLAMWGDAALRLRDGAEVQVPPLFPMLAAALSSWGAGGVATSGVVLSRWLSLATPVALALLAGWRFGRLAGAVTFGVLAAVADFVVSGAMFGPDALAVAAFGLFGALVLACPAQLPRGWRGGTWVAGLACTSALATLAREPGLFVAIGGSLALWPALRGWVAVPLLSALAAPGVNGWPTSLGAWLPALHKLEPVAHDLRAPGVPAYLLDVTQSWPGPFASVEDLVRSHAAVDLAAGAGLVQRLAWNAAHAVVAEGDLLALSVLALVAARAAERAGQRGMLLRLAALLLPLAGALVAWSQRRHALWWVGIDAVALGAGLAALSGQARVRLGVATGLALALGLGTLPGAAEWVRDRAEMDAEAARIGKAIRRRTPPDDLLWVEGGDGRGDIVLRLTAERGKLRPGAKLDERTCQRVTWVSRGLKRPGDNWQWVTHAGDLGLARCAVDPCKDIDCYPNHMEGERSYGLVPGDGPGQVPVVTGAGGCSCN